MQVTYKESAAFAYSGNEFGLTKREYFAAHVHLTEDEVSYGRAKFIMGSEPPNDVAENRKWWFAAEAKLRVMKADALIEALNDKT